VSLGNRTEPGQALRLVSHLLWHVLFASFLKRGSMIQGCWDRVPFSPLWAYISLFAPVRLFLQAPAHVQHGWVCKCLMSFRDVRCRE
jgi:hypothetical protein